MPAPANEALFDATVRHQVKLLRLTKGESNRAAAVLAESERELVDAIKSARLDSWTEQRLRALLAEVRRIRATAFGRVGDELASTLAEVAHGEADWELEAIRSSAPVQLDLVTPSVATLKAVAGRPINGIPLEGWLGDLTKKDVQRIEQQVRLGLVQGETVDQIVGRVRGTRANAFEDGVVAVSRRNAQTIVRTAVNHASNSARQEVWNANADIIQGVRWVATLDGRTSDVCRGRDGKVYPIDEGPRPPAHPGCRSTMTAVLNGKQIVGDRPAVTDVRTRRQREVDFRREAQVASGEKWAGMSAAERAEAIRAQRDSWTAANVGTVPSDVTYDSWLRRQSREFQDDVLGRGKAQLFRDGMTLDKFVDKKGRAYSLQQLKAELAGDKLNVAQPGVGMKAKALLQTGMSSQEVLDAILKEFPDAKTTTASIASYKVELKKAGLLDELASTLPASALKQAQAAADVVKHLDDSLPAGLKHAVGGQWASVVEDLEGSPGAYGYYKAGKGVVLSGKKLSAIPSVQAKQVAAHELGHLLHKQHGLGEDISKGMLEDISKGLSADGKKQYAYYLSHTDELVAEINAQAISPSPITSQGLSATEFNKQYGGLVELQKSKIAQKFPAPAAAAKPPVGGPPTAPYEVAGKHTSASSLAKAMLQQGAPEPSILAAVKAEFPGVSNPGATLASAKTALKKELGAAVAAAPAAAAPSSAAALDLKALTPVQKEAYNKIKAIVKDLKEPAFYMESGTKSALPPWAFSAFTSGGVSGPLWKLKNVAGMAPAEAESLFVKMFQDVKAKTGFRILGGWDELLQTSGVNVEAKLADDLVAPALKPGPVVTATKAVPQAAVPVGATVAEEVKLVFPELSVTYPADAVLSGIKLKELGVEMFEQGVLDNKDVADLLAKLYPKSAPGIKVANVASWKTNWKKQFPERFAAAEKKVAEAKQKLAQVAKQSAPALKQPALYGKSLGPYASTALQDVKVAIAAGETDGAKLLKLVEKAFAPKNQAFDAKAGGDIVDLAKYEVAVGKAAGKPYLGGAYSAKPAAPAISVDLTPARPAVTPREGLPPPPRFTAQQRRAAIKALAGGHVDDAKLAAMNAKQKAAGLPELTAEESAAIRQYTGGIYRKLNRDLRGGEYASRNELQAYVEAAQHGLDKMPKFVGDVSRGMSLDAMALQRAVQTYKPGAIVEEHAFISTSRGDTAAFGGNMFVKIKSKTGVDVSSYSYYPGEREVLFKPGTRLRVLKLEQHGSKHVVYMEEV